MKNKAYVIWIYSTIALIGGIVGFVKTGSLMSIVSASVIALALDISGFYILKGKEMAHNAALALLFFTLIFFGYRFFLTYKMMPAGLMIFLTLTTMGYLLTNNRLASHKI
jgi:uncharacterized membrane protein (UPF0136 family)